VVHEALERERHLTAESLWPINVHYFRDQGAKFAGILATVPAAANATKKENSYLFRKDVIFSAEDSTDMNRDFEMHLTTGKILKILRVIVLGVLTSNYSFGSFRALLRSVTISGKIRKHYEGFPETRSSFAPWVDRAEALWKQANAKMK
jgi:hypothetical protein